MVIHDLGRSVLTRYVGIQLLPVKLDVLTTKMIVLIPAEDEFT